MDGGGGGSDAPPPWDGGSDGGIDAPPPWDGGPDGGSDGGIDAPPPWDGGPDGGSDGGIDAPPPWDGGPDGGVDGGTEQGTFPDPNGPPPPPETTCDCIDADADQICDAIDDHIEATSPALKGRATPLIRQRTATFAAKATASAFGKSPFDLAPSVAATNAWGCEYSKPTCVAPDATACRAIKDCEWAGGGCREKACVASWRQLCLDYINRAAAGDKYAYRGNSTWMSSLFTTGPAPVRPEWQWGSVDASVNYTWEGHSSVTRVNSFLTFVTEVVRDRIPTGTTYNLTNNGCGTFNVTNFQTIRTYMRNTLHPLLRAANPRKTAVLCGQQNVCSSNDSTAYRPCGDGQCAGARGNDFSRICFSIDGNAAAPTITYNVFNQCRPGGSCTDWPGHNLSWCRDATTNAWACQRCRLDGANWKFESRPIGDCNTAAGL